MKLRDLQEFWVKISTYHRIDNHLPVSSASKLKEKAFDFSINTSADSFSVSHSFISDF